MNYKLRNARHRRPPAPGMDVLEKRTCSKWPGGHRVRSGKWTLQMHARTPPAPNITLAAPRRGMGSRKASGALSPRGWLRWVTLCALLRKPPRRPPPPTTSPARLQGRTVDSAEGLGWSKEVRGVGGVEDTPQGPWSEWAGRPLCGAGAQRGNPVYGFSGVLG